MLIAGISAFYHESTCCLFRDGHLLAAAAEERFSRLKHDPALPVEAFRFCLERAGATVADLDAVAYYERPVDKLSRQLWAGPRRHGGGGEDRELAWLDPSAPERALREDLGWEGPVLAFPHHLSHAASSFYLSGFREAALLTADGVGEWATTTWGRGAGDDLELFAAVDFPHSLGLFYSTFTAWLGFRVSSGEYKVMGLAPYGTPRFAGELRRVLRSLPGPRFELDPECFDFVAGERMWSPALAERLEALGVPRRRPGAPLEPVHADLAASLQRVLEEVLLEKVRWLAGEVPSENLCLAGGVALNCVANGRIRREGGFHRLFVQPAAGDSGGAVGAAALAHRRLAGRRPATGAPGAPLAGVRLGPAWSADEVAELLAAAGLLDVVGLAEGAALRGTVAPPGMPGVPGRSGPARGGAAEAAASPGPGAAAPAPEPASPPWSYRVGGGEGAPVLDFRGREGELLAAVAERLAAGRVVGLFQGALELGPRALGGRSILADPRDPGMRDRVNARVKKREGFRPFAPAVLAARAAEHFELGGDGGEAAAAGSPFRFMLETCPVASPLDLPAVTHVDGSARPQVVDPGSSPRFAGLLAAFEARTGCPVLLNTSFNVAGEPIVASPADALLTFAAAGLDVLVLEDFVLDREALGEVLGEEWVEALARQVEVWRSDRRRPGGGGAGGLEGRLYTFV